MALLNRLLGSESPKLARPMQTMIGFVMQTSRRFEHVRIQRDGYVLPFFCSSNTALTYWVVPDFVDPTEEFVRSFLRPGDVFVDVGANIGTVSALAAGLVGPSGRVVSIEPHPSTFANLRQMISANGLENVECLDLACGSSIGVANLTDLGRKDDNNSIELSGDGLPVRVSTLAHVVRACSLDRVDLLKVDVEGFEGAVLRGLTSELSRVGALYVEIIDANLRRYGDSTGAIVALLQDNGFACFGIPDDPTNLVALSSAAHGRKPCGLDAMPGNPVLE